jgi:hypothetical protein
MATGIRFPVDLPIPNRDGYSSTFEVNVIRQEREIGSARQRRITRSQPRLESLSLSLTESEYLIFDTWWQETIKSGELLFDILLSDDLGESIWYTARWLGDYEATIDSSRYDWVIKGTLRLIGNGFTVRLSGTDELHGSSITSSNARGNLTVASILRGRSVTTSNAIARFSNATLLGLSETEFSGKAKLGLLVLHGISSSVTNGKTQLGALVLRGVSTIVTTGEAELGLLLGLSTTTSSGKGGFA